MQLHKMKKLDIVIETAQREKIIEIIQESDATGYTIYSNVDGEGMRECRDDVSFTYTTKNVKFFVIGPEEVIHEIIEKISELMPNCASILYVSDVEVLRKGQFSQKVVKRAVRRYKGIEA
ncbi:MAG: hypothetical protein GTO13_05700 [Proteobacteria bacterium]|nr:hypothetical protein [Pseudomonadota bacterium]